MAYGGERKKEAEARRERIIALAKTGFTAGEIAARVNVGRAWVWQVLTKAKMRAKQPTRRSFSFTKRQPVEQRSKPVHITDDPLMDIGFELIDLPTDGCRYPIARWPMDYPKQRFCGCSIVDGANFLYCAEHMAVCTQPRQEPPKPLARAA